MAPITFSVDAATRRLDEDGFLDLEVSDIGEHLQTLEDKGFPLVSEHGLRFCKEQVLENEHIRDIAKAILGKCTFGHWLRYKAYPGHIVSFRSGGPKAGRHSLLVHLWAKGSQAEYYGGSHLHDLPKKKGARLLWENQPSALAAAGCVATKMNFPQGGVVVLDSRVDYMMKEGYVITFVFATDDLVESWSKLKVPASLETLVASMQSEAIRVNYEIITE